jgi:hypothetical protein
LEGGLLPIISLTSLHFFTKYDDGKFGNEEVKEVIKEVIVEKEVIKEVPVIEYVEIEKPVYIKENLFNENTGEIDLSQDEQPISSEIFFPNPINDEFVSPGMDIQEPPRPNRLSYVKP